MEFIEKMDEKFKGKKKQVDVEIYFIDCNCDFIEHVSLYAQIVESKMVYPAKSCFYTSAS